MKYFYRIQDSIAGNRCNSIFVGLQQLSYSRPTTIFDMDLVILTTISRVLLLLDAQSAARNQYPMGCPSVPSYGRRCEYRDYSQGFSRRSNTI